MSNKSMLLQEHYVFKIDNNSRSVDETDVNMATQSIVKNNDSSIRDNVPIYFSKGSDNLQVKNNNNEAFDKISDDTERTYSSLCTVDVTNDNIQSLDIDRNKTNENVVNNNSTNVMQGTSISKDISSNGNSEKILTASIVSNISNNGRNTNSNAETLFTECDNSLRTDTQRSDLSRSNSLLNSIDSKLTRSVQLSGTNIENLNIRRNSEMASSTYTNANRELSHVIQRNQSIPVQIPIIGYEVMEERARFTIYKLRIDDPRTGLSWMVFRRYTDFVRLYSKLKLQHKNLCLPLPEKRRFRNNFNPTFLDERVQGLQIFVNNVVKKLSSDINVREFFCLDEPPPVADSEPEAQALFGALEDTVGALKNQLRQQEEAMKYMRQKIFYLEEKMKHCQTCNPTGKHMGGSPDSAGSSNGS